VDDVDIAAYLERGKVPFAWRPHRRALTAQELAQVLGVRGYQVVKTVIVEADGCPWIAALPAPLVVDVDCLATALDALSVRLLTEDEFAPLFLGCEVGAEPPLGRLYDLPVVVDRQLARQSHLIFRAGTHEATAGLSWDDFVRLESPRVAVFAVAPPARPRPPVPAGAWTA